MDITVIANPRAAHQQTHQHLLAAGLRVLGHRPILQASQLPIRTHHVACWAWHLGKRLRAQGHDVLVMERGYLGDRFAWTSLAWNGLNNRGWTAPPPDDGGARFERHFAQLLRPWNPRGAYVLLIGQVPGDASLRGRDLNPWYERTAAQAANDYGLPVIFRPHPEALRRGMVKPVPSAQMRNGDLAMALAGARLVITYNSNTGVDALMAGKMVTAADEGSMIWNAHDRGSWAHRLAWRQWQTEEIASGEALMRLGFPHTGPSLKAA